MLLLDVSPEYDECPAVCPKGMSEDGKFCDGCDIKVSKEIFREETIGELDKKLGIKWNQYGFDNLLTSVLSVTAIEDDDRAKWDITTETLFNVYLSQRNRLQRVDHWNFKQKMKNKD